MNATETKIFQEMVAECDTLIITDPCYILTDESWDKFGRTPYIYDNGQEFLSTLNFGDCIIADTGYGDWSNSITNTETGENLGDFCADAGMVCVVKASDLMNYFNGNKELEKKLQDYIERGLATSIPNYTGKITLSYIEDENEFPSKWAMIKGTGDFDFSSDER